MNYAKYGYKKVFGTETNLEGNEICLSCYADTRIDDCELVKRIEKHRIKFLYVITMPLGRAATIELESQAIEGLTTRPIITNMDKRFFVVLRDVEAKRE